MIRLVLVGSGNVATQLFWGFSNSKTVKVIQVVGRNTSRLQSFEQYAKTGSLEEVLPDADIYIIAVSDDAISTVYQKLNVKSKLIVHTSGTVPLKVLPDLRNQGVFYPLQTFTCNRLANFTTVPVCIEAQTGSGLEVLRHVAQAVSEKVVEIGSDQRAYLHLAAVFANNFSNHLFHISNEILLKCGLPFDLLLPLILETTNKLEDSTPYEAQTGPARRQDAGTLDQHLHLLEDKKYREIYALLSTSIQTAYAKKL